MRRYPLLLSVVACCTTALLAGVSYAASDRGRSADEAVSKQPAANTSAVRVSDTAGAVLPLESAYQTKWQVMAAGGSTGTSGGFALGSTIGQTAVGIGTAGTTVLRHGFWQNLPLWVSCCYGPSLGNLDHSADGWVTMGDLTLLIDHLFISLEPLVCMDEANVDLSPDHLVTSGDLMVMIDHLCISLAPLPACP